MNRLGLSISALFVLALLMYLPTWMSQEPEQAVKTRDDALTPSYRAKNLTTTLYNADGKLDQKVFARAMEHYDQLGFVLFQQPQYTVYVDNDEPPWEVTAQEGTLYDNNLIQLDSDVVIKSLKQDDFVNSIATEFMEINLDTKVMTSDQPVLIRGADFVINSNGFNANLNTRQYELIDHVQTIYSPSH